MDFSKLPDLATVEKLVKELFDCREEVSQLLDALDLDIEGVMALQNDLLKTVYGLSTTKIV